NRERLSIVHRNALRLLKLVNSLLDFSRIEAGRAQAFYERTDLAVFTADLASNFRSAIERAGLRLVVGGDPLPEPVYLDRDMWEKVVLNLLSNALKHTFEGEIRVTTEAIDHRAVLTVQDTGVGIAADQLPRIFERFHRVPNVRSRTHEGTGIGLALVQELVKLQGGTIAVASTPGSGTTFTVGIPFGTAHVPAERVMRDVVHPTDSARGRSVAASYVEEALRWLPDASHPDHDPSGDRGLVEHGSALVADDNADMRDYVTRLLRERGWRVTAVPNGAAALEAVRADTPDVILSDVMMPELDGFQLLSAIRADPHRKSMPFILLSARAGEEARVEGLRAGADDYLVKPFSARELVSRVDAQMRRGKELAYERRRTDEHQRVLAAIEAERARFRHLFVQAPAAIAVFRGPEHVFEIANPSYLGLFGNGEVLGKPLREALPDREHQGMYEIFDTVYQTGQPVGANEFRAVFDPDGDGVSEEHFYNFVCQPIRDENDNVEGIFFHAVEVSDLVRARREAEQTRLDAEEANRAKSEFLAAMSHELRTPLNAIAGHAELLDMGLHGPVTAGQHEALGRIQRSEAHLLSLINDVLNFAKIEAGHTEYALGDVHLWEVVEEVLSMVQPMLAARKLSSDVRVARDVVARGDREKVKQILLNLLSNAVKFTDAGGHIEIETPEREVGHAPSDFALLRISDTGIGIPRDRQEVVFDPFVQIHRKLTHTTEGTGLGLAISRDLARGMGGDLRVRTTESGGSAFTLALPTAESPLDDVST
ncbi:MAG TPA: ATP-binding protein, partial [Gemmatimonadaceae bacterium]|nr:ATP-binding protein [Gemmatimonadaceae bacterium]